MSVGMMAVETPFHESQKKPICPRLGTTSGKDLPDPQPPNLYFSKVEPAVRNRPRVVMSLPSGSTDRLCMFSDQEDPSIIARTTAAMGALDVDSSSSVLGRSFTNLNLLVMIEDSSVRLPV